MFHLMLVKLLETERAKPLGEQDFTAIKEGLDNLSAGSKSAAVKISAEGLKLQVVQ